MTFGGASLYLRVLPTYSTGMPQYTTNLLYLFFVVYFILSNVAFITNINRLPFTIYWNIWKVLT